MTAHARLPFSSLTVDHSIKKDKETDRGPPCGEEKEGSRYFLFIFI